MFAQVVFGGEGGNLKKKKLPKKGELFFFVKKLIQLLWNRCGGEFFNYYSWGFNWVRKCFFFYAKSENVKIDAAIP